MFIRGRIRLYVLLLPLLVAAGCAQRDLGSTCFDYFHRPVGYHWLGTRDPSGASRVYYGRDPKTGWTVYVGPDSKYYTFKHAGAMAPSDLGSGWRPHDAYSARGRGESCEPPRVVSQPVPITRTAPPKRPVSEVEANWSTLIDIWVESVTHTATNVIVDVLLCALLASLPLQSRFRPKASLQEAEREWPRTQEALLPIITAAVVFTCGFHWLLLGKGVPILRHDWSWPADAIELRSFFASIYSPWSLGGVGAPSVYPTLYPLAWLMSGLGYALTTKGVLDVVVAASFFAAFLGVYALVRAQEIRKVGRVSALIAAVVYASSPYFVNKFVAGHYLALVAYGLLPILALLAVESEKRPGRTSLAFNAVLGGLVVGFSAVQIQFFAFDAVLLLLMCLTSRKPLRLTLFAFGALSIGLATQIFSIGNLLFADRTGVALPAPSTLEWFRDMSVGPQFSVLGYGYLVDYARWSLKPSISDAPWYIAGLVGLLCVIATLLISRSLRWPSVFLAGVFLASGTIGPGGQLKAWVFQHVAAASLVRELYNCTAIALFGLALCLGLLADWILERSKQRGMFAVRILLGCGLVFVALAAIAPFASGLFAKDIYLWTVPASYEELGDLVSRSPSARIAFLPAAAPLHSTKTIDTYYHVFAGTDVWQTEFRGHPVIFEYEPNTVGAVALGALGREDYREAARVYGLIGVKYLVSRHDIQSYLPKFWFPDLFSRTWSAGSDLSGVGKARTFVRRIGSNQDFDLYENSYYVPLVSVAQGVMTCDRSAVYEAAFADGSGCSSAAHLQPAAFLPVPDHDSFNPFVAWVSAQKFYFLNRSTALHWQSIFSLSSRPYTMRFHLDGMRRLYWSCIGQGPAKIVVDGRRRTALRCASETASRDLWQSLGILQAGDHSLFVRKRSGSLILNPVLAYRWKTKVVPPIDPAVMAVVGNARGQTRGEVLSFTRTEADRISGEYVCRDKCLLIFSDAFNPRWRLTLDDKDSVASAVVNLTENGFTVGSGRHSFTIDYVLAGPAKIALFVQACSWPAAAVALLLIFALTSSREIIEEKKAVNG